MADETLHPPVDIAIDRYRVAVLTEADSIDWWVWDIHVEHRGRGRWAISRGGGIVLSADGKWVVEPINSERTDAWLDSHRFDVDTAIELACREAPRLSINGLTPADVLARRRSLETTADRYADDEEAAR